MSEHNETLAEIAAALRHNSKGLMFYLRKNEDGSTHAMGADYVDLADRIEAAWKRQEQCYLDQIRDAVNMIGHERFVKEHPSVGNAAAIREALTKVSEWMAHRIATGGFEASPTIPTVLEDVVLPALAAPPRNCDRFGGDIDRLREACLRERGLNPDEDFPEIFCEWLLAAAKKGGAQ